MSYTPPSGSNITFNAVGDIYRPPNAGALLFTLQPRSAIGPGSAVAPIAASTHKSTLSISSGSVCTPFSAQTLSSISSGSQCSFQSPNGNPSFQCATTLAIAASSVAASSPAIGTGSSLSANVVIPLPSSLSMAVSSSLAASGGAISRFIVSMSCNATARFSSAQNAPVASLLRCASRFDPYLGATIRSSATVNAATQFRALGKSAHKSSFSGSTGTNINFVSSRIFGAGAMVAGSSAIFADAKRVARGAAFLTPGSATSFVSQSLNDQLPSIPVGTHEFAVLTQNKTLRVFTNGL